ncbi:substrate-binding domain-containing protein [Roseateles sp. BYS180W]|uniref:Substrate-binding domain-containing protein n=1 Tax=Roseateles rivi TaxID=3299028 RepID=A0ABW7FWX8_9BURK
MVKPTGSGQGAVVVVKTAACVALALGAAGMAVAGVSDELIRDLPADLKVLYKDAPQTIHPSAFDDFKAVKGPLKWCHSESYQGNPWRVSLAQELKRLVLSTPGASFEMADSNGDVSQQISQIRTFIDKKCSVISSVPGSATALNEAVAAAYKAGIPFVTAAGSVSSPYALNVDSNFGAWGYDMMKAIAKELGGKGSVLMVEGIAGNPIVAQERQGADRALAEHPGLKLARVVNGNWTANVTKTVVLQALATHPGPIDAVWTAGSESRVVAEAFAQAGRPAPLITGSVTGDAIGYWKANPSKYRFAGHGVWPQWTGQTLYRAAMRLLDGQKPRLNTLMLPLPVVGMKDLANMHKPCMTADAVSVFPTLPSDPVPERIFDAYFRNPAPTRNWDYAKAPSACP